MARADIRAILTIYAACGLLALLALAATARLARI